MGRAYFSACFASTGSCAVSELFRNVPFLTHEKISPFVWSIVVAGQECGRQWGRAAAGPSSARRDPKSTRLNSSHLGISYAVFCLKKKKSSTLRRDGRYLRTSSLRLTRKKPTV